MDPKPPPRYGGNAARFRSLRGGLLVSILEGGRRRPLAGEIGDEGVKAVDHHFLRGHHHPADRRGSYAGGCCVVSRAGESTAGAATVTGFERGGRGGRRDKEAMRLFLLTLKRGAFASARGCLVGRFCPLRDCKKNCLCSSNRLQDSNSFFSSG